GHARVHVREVGQGQVVAVVAVVDERPAAVVVHLAGQGVHVDVVDDAPAPGGYARDRQGQLLGQGRRRDRRGGGRGRVGGRGRFGRGVPGVDGDHDRVRAGRGEPAADVPVERQIIPGLPGDRR